MSTFRDHYSKLGHCLWFIRQRINSRRRVVTDQVQNFQNKSQRGDKRNVTIHSETSDGLLSQLMMGGFFSPLWLLPAPGHLQADPDTSAIQRCALQHSTAPWCSSTRLTPEHAHTRETLHRRGLQTQTVTLPSTFPAYPHFCQLSHVSRVCHPSHIFHSHLLRSQILNADIPLSGSSLL